jgi:hypothetical protein
MDLPTLEKRVRRLEMLSSRIKLIKASPAGEPINDKVSLLEQLEDLGKQLTLMREEAYASGDHRMALAFGREFCRVAELEAKLAGKLDERSQSKVSNEHIDSGTAKRMAQAYLDRHKDGESNE